MPQHVNWQTPPPPSIPRQWGPSLRDEHVVYVHHNQHVKHILQQNIYNIMDQDTILKTYNSAIIALYFILSLSGTN